MIEKPSSPDNLPRDSRTSSPLLGRVAGATALIAGFTLLARAVGLLREMIVARTYGASADLDAFFVALTVPDLISYLVLYVALYLFLPVYSRERARSPESASLLASAFWNRALLGLAFLAFILVTGAPLVIRGLAPELQEPQYRLALESLRLLAFLVLLRGLEGILRGLVNAHRRFFLPVLATLIVSAVTITFVLVWGRRGGVMALSWGWVVGSTAPVLLVLPLALRHEPGLLSRALNHPALRAVRKLLPWVVAIEVASLILPLVDRGLASRFLGPGCISALAYARTLSEVPFTLVGLTLATALFPEFAALWSRRDEAGFQRVLRRGARAVLALILPVTVLLLVLARPLVAALYQRGAFGPEATVLTADALRAYALGLPFLCVSALLVLASYAAGKLRSLLFVKLAALAVKVGVSAALLSSLAQTGIALGTSAFFLVVCLALVPFLLGSFAGLLPRPLIVLPATGMSVGIGWALCEGLTRYGWKEGIDAILVQVLAWGVTFGLYLLFCRWGHVEEVLEMEHLLRKRLFGRGRGG
jgi:putative peptidoglycan lipid II flippase